MGDQRTRLVDALGRWEATIGENVAAGSDKLREHLGEVAAQIVGTGGDGTRSESILLDALPPATRKRQHLPISVSASNGSFRCFPCPPATSSATRRLFAG